MFEELEIDSIYAWLLAHNSVVASLHQRVGFEAGERLPLIKVEDKGTLRFERGYPMSDSRCDVYAHESL